jgi:hypothetical protein
MQCRVVNSQVWLAIQAASVLLQICLRDVRHCYCQCLIIVAHAWHMLGFRVTAEESS